MKIFEFPETRVDPALTPSAVLLFPEVLLERLFCHTEALYPPVVFWYIALDPIAVFANPVVFAVKAAYPTATP